MRFLRFPWTGLDWSGLRGNCYHRLQHHIVTGFHSGMRCNCYHRPHHGATGLHGTSDDCIHWQVQVQVVSKKMHLGRCGEARGTTVDEGTIFFPFFFSFCLFTPILLGHPLRVFCFISIQPK